MKIFTLAIGFLFITSTALADDRCVWDGSARYDMNAGAFAACAFLEALGSGNTCAYNTYVHLDTGEPCDPDSEGEDTTETEAVEYYWQVVGMHGCELSCVNYDAPLPPMWMLISQDDWDNMRSGFGFDPN